MKCSACGFENPKGMNFCGNCAASLGPGCPKCGFNNPLGFLYCGNCSAPISENKEEAKTEPKAPNADTKSPEAERRQITVMFCDLVGSTALSEKLDPEDMRQIMHKYQEVCAEGIGQFDGHIAKYLGDGILVYFGYPVAHEDDARRAVKAGLKITETMSKSPLTFREHKISAEVRIGIHTGLVIAGEMGVEEVKERMAIVGETPNIAARIQGVAGPNTVCISAVTHKLVEGYFECEDLGEHDLKGISSPIAVYKAIQVSEEESPIEIAIKRGLTPLVGRQQEIGLLLDRWERVKEGMGQVVLLNGEAGIGKSRLVSVLIEQLVDESYIRMVNRCSPYYQNSVFFTLIDHIERLLDFSREDSAEEKISKVEKALEKYELDLKETVPLFASLLSVPLSSHYTPLALTPQMQKQRTMETLIACLLAEADKQPVLYIVEDLHWVDHSTKEFLNMLVEQVPNSRMFVLLTFRPEFSPEWQMRSHFGQIILSRLPKKQVEKMVKSLSVGIKLPEETINQIISQTDGVPLYVEEITKMVLESGPLNGGDKTELPIPVSLQDSLAARLDRIASGEICSLGATLGRSFTYELIKSVSRHDEQSLQKELKRLVEAEILYQRGVPPRASYIFKHALIQEAAYQSLLKTKRQKYHGKIASTMDKEFPQVAEAHPEILAHHYAEAGQSDKAIKCWKRAGLLAAQRSANVEAIGHYNKCLNMLKTLPNSNELVELELELQIALGVPLTATKGYGSPEAELAYNRARELCKEAGETPQVMSALRGLMTFYLAQAKYQIALELANELISLANKEGDLGFLIEAHLGVGIAHYVMGDLVPAQTNLDKALSICVPEKHGSQAFTAARDPAVASLCWSSFVLLHLGYPDRAAKNIEKAMVLARELSHPLSIIYAFHFGAWLHLKLRDPSKAIEFADQEIELSNEQGTPYYLAAGNFVHGWVMVEQGSEEHELINMQKGIDSYKNTGMKIYCSYYYLCLADSYRKIGRFDEAMLILSEAENLVKENKEYFCEAELCWVKGHLISGLSKENKGEAENCFRKSVKIAKSRGSKFVELRAVISLSCLLQSQDKKEEAKAMLEETYSWFTEGFDTKDLKEAKALLQQYSCLD